MPSQSLDRRSCSVDNPFAAGPAPALLPDHASLRDGLVPPAAGRGRALATPRSPSAPSALLQNAAKSGADEAAAHGRPHQIEPRLRSHSEGDGGGLRAGDGGAAAQGSGVRGSGSAGPGRPSGATEPAPPPYRAAGLGEGAEVTQEAQERPPGSASHTEAAAPLLSRPPAGQQQQAAPSQPSQAHAQAREQLEQPAQLPQASPPEASPASEHDTAHSASSASAGAAAAPAGKAAEQPASHAARGSPKPVAPNRGEPGGPSRPARPEGGEAAGRGPPHGTERRPGSKAERRELQERQKAAKEAARKVHQASHEFWHAISCRMPFFSDAYMSRSESYQMIPNGELLGCEQIVFEPQKTETRHYVTLLRLKPPASEAKCSMPYLPR